jgi:hypothetical protein
MRPIIFLEIEGVLTTQNGANYWMKKTGDIFDEDGIECFCPKAVEALNKITTATGADIVIISNWRLAFALPKLQELFINRHITGDVIGYTPFISKDTPRG